MPQKQSSRYMKEAPNNHEADCGVIYVAFGIPYLLQTLHSYRTLRRNNPDIPVKIITNVLSYTVADPLLTIQHIDAPDEENRKYKTSVYQYSPFRKTLYLDADTEVLGDISLGFEFLEWADIAIRPAPCLIKNVSTEPDPKKAYHLARTWGEFNGGVFFFRKSGECERFFRYWNDDIKENDLKRDQKALLRSIAQNRSMSIWPLGPAWNYTRYDYRTHKLYSEQKRLRSEPFIWHYINFSFCVRALSDIINMSKDSEVFWAEVVSLAFLKTFILVPFIERWIPCGASILKYISATKRFVTDMLKRNY